MINNDQATGSFFCDQVTVIDDFLPKEQFEQISSLIRGKYLHFIS